MHALFLAIVPLPASGHIGFGSYVSGAATNGPITIAVDQLVVTAP